MGFLVVISTALWFFLGNPAKNVADWFWPSEAAPWEQVDAFYYPDRTDLTQHREIAGLEDLGACREAIGNLASAFKDAAMVRGDYECGVGPLRLEYGFRIYRITAK
jgi:hypothetical protein